MIKKKEKTKKEKQRKRGEKREKQKKGKKKKTKSNQLSARQLSWNGDFISIFDELPRHPELIPSHPARNCHSIIFLHFPRAVLHISAVTGDKTAALSPRADCSESLNRIGRPYPGFLRNDRKKLISATWTMDHNWLTERNQSHLVL